MIGPKWLRPISPRLIAWFFDGVLGTWVANPLVSCTLMASLGLYSMVLLLQMYALHGSLVFIEEPSRFGSEICVQLLNVVVVWRFPSRSAKGLLVQSNLALEALLFATSNVIAVLMMREACFLPPSDGILIFRIVIWGLLICPYAILLADVFEIAYRRCKKDTPGLPSFLRKTPLLPYPLSEKPLLPYVPSEKLAFTHRLAETPALELRSLLVDSLVESVSVSMMDPAVEAMADSREPPLLKPARLTKLLTETNNAFLAAFIAQSFAHTHINMPFLDLQLSNTIFAVCTYIFKLHIVHMFWLYETVVVIFEIENLVAYSELYEPVSLGRANSWYAKMRHYDAVVMTSWIVFIILYDTALMGLSIRNK